MVLLVAMLEPSSAQFMGPYIRTNLSMTVIVKYPEQHLTVGNNSNSLLMT